MKSIFKMVDAGVLIDFFNNVLFHSVHECGLVNSIFHLHLKYTARVK